MDFRNKLLSLSNYCEGNYEKMFSMIKSKEIVDDKYSKEIKSNFLTILDTNYPKRLKNIYKPPILFYYYGNISLLDSKKILAVVGSREVNSYQESMTNKLVDEVLSKSENKVTILSGMAKGVDQIAMKQAMKRNANIISVIASGIDNPYPKDNSGIYEYCKGNKGLIISERPLTYSAVKEDFIFRNRLLAGLSDAVLVTAGKKHSGTASTVRFGIDFGKEILSLPCNVTGDDLTNTLILDGARMILSSDDIIDSLTNIF